MTKTEFAEYIKKGLVYLDGATGSNLMKQGMPFGVCPETWILEHPEVLKSLQQEYVASGSNIVYAPTFTANRIKLKEYGLQERLVEINTELVRLSKEAVSGQALVAGDITMTGESLYPLGSLTFDKLVEVYEEQIGVLYEAGCDLLVVETMMSLQETRAALIAAQKWDLPVMATMTFEENGRTLYGTDAKTVLLVLQGLGADAVGINCSAGPDKLAPLLKEMAEYAVIPLIAKPNAGMPKMGENGETVFDMEADAFALLIPSLYEAGAHIIGGCCGTAPEYIAKAKATLDEAGEERMFESGGRAEKALTTERNTYPVEEDWIFGEAITLENEELVEELLEGDTDTLLDLLDEEMDEEVDALIISGSKGGAEEKECLLKIVEELGRSTTIPLIFHVEDKENLEAVLRSYGGVAGVRGVSQEAEQLAKKYGAVVF